MISVAEALARILGDAAPVAGREDVPLGLGLGRVLAESVVAERTQPDFDASAMDGYAVRAADTLDPARSLAIIGESAAGAAFAGSLQTGEAVRIFTGAPVPEGADAVLIQENAHVADGACRALEPVAPAGHIRRAGNDFRRGDALLAAGTVLTPGRIALAASANRASLSVLRRPRVAILATGDELVLPGSPVGPSQIVASNHFGIAAIVSAAGGEPLDYGIAPDDEPALAAMVARARDDAADILVTIGGASVGDRDLVGRVFAKAGVGLDFWKVRMRPGKPLMAGRLGAMRVLGLPGNPASSMVTATLFLKPLVRRLAGLADLPFDCAGILGADVRGNDERQDFMRAVLSHGEDGSPRVTPLPRQDSSLLSIYARADALLVREPGAPPARAGEPCRFVDLD